MARSVPQAIPYTHSLFASFKREPVYRVFSHIRRTHITFMRRWHSFSSFIPHRHSQTHFQRRCLGHTSFSMHGDRRVYSVPRFHPGIDPFIGHPSRNGKMPVYRAPCIWSQIHRDTTTSMALGPSAKPPHPSFFFVMVAVQGEEHINIYIYTISVMQCAIIWDKKFSAYWQYIYIFVHYFGITEMICRSQKLIFF